MTTAGTGRLEPLATPNFRYFFLGEVVNTAGSSMSGVALAFAVLAISDSPTALGVVVAAWTVPMVALMLLGGAVSDRLPRAIVLRGCNLIQGVTQAASAALVVTGHAQVWQLAVLQFISGTVFAVSYPAFHGMVPILLPPPKRKAAFLLLSQSESALSILGPAVAGILVATVGPGWGLAVDAATYAVAAGFLAVLRIPVGERPDKRPSVIGDFVAGWSFVRSLGWVIPVASCSLVFNALISGALGVLGPAIAEDTIGSDGWGLARSGQAIGVFVAAFVLAKVTIGRPLRTCVIGFSLSALPMLVLGTRVGVVALALAFVVAGVGLSALDLAWNLTVQEKVPEQMLSRVMSIDGFFSFVAMPIGQLAVGPLAVAFGTQRVELGAAALCILVALVGATRPVIADVRLEGGAR
ncbi:MAG: MFS transporter [Nocardioides sp.]|uniref:MFS transporter n=1 Tax=Nocardioides sp. TaxID=35761 RepID=UPI0039E6E6AA